MARRAKACSILVLKTSGSLTCKLKTSIFSLNLFTNSTPLGVMSGEPLSFWMKFSLCLAGSCLRGVCWTAKTLIFFYPDHLLVCFRVKWLPVCVAGRWRLLFRRSVFGKCCATRAEPQKPTDRLTKAERSQLDKDLLGYLSHGGFPEAQGLDTRNRFELLRTYVDVVLLRDVVERHNLSQPQVLHWMVRQLLGNAAGSFSINKFHADLKSRGVAVGKDTLHSYLAHLEDAFLLSSLDLATDSERRRQVNPRKVYPVDTGLMALFDRSGKANVGHALETSVLHELLRRGAEVNYVRTLGGFEVDFYARAPDGDEVLIQVCVDLDNPDTLAREVRALQDAAAAWPNASLQLISFNQPKGMLPPEIQLYLASDWLLTRGLGGRSYI